MDVFHTFRRSGDENTGAAGASEELTEQFLTLADVWPSAADLIHAAEARLFSSPVRAWRRYRLIEVALQERESETTRAWLRSQEEQARHLGAVARQRAQELADLHTLAEAERARQRTPRPMSAREDQTQAVGDGCAKVASQPWAQNWQREWQPIMRVLGGARELGKLDELVQGNQFKFSTTELIEALRKWRSSRELGVVPEKSDQVLGRALRGFSPSFEWRSGNPGADEKARRTLLLVECYQAGKVADDDDELDGLLHSAGFGALLQVA